MFKMVNQCGYTFDIVRLPVFSDRSKGHMGTFYLASGLFLLMLVPGIMLYRIVHLEHPKSTHYFSLNGNSADQKTPNWQLATRKCRVNCVFGTPCMYNDQVDFRIIVMTYNRATSLRKCLDKLKNLIVEQEELVSIEIWIDRHRGPDGHIDKDVHQVAMMFQTKWSTENRRICIHVQTENAFIVGQWVNTWRPRENSKEIGLILEDDIDVSPYAYRWLKAAHGQYDSEPDLAGVTLQMENIHFFGGVGGQMKGPSNDTVFMYPVLGTWGYSPHPDRWREFQDWHKRNYEQVKPYVPGIFTTVWYKQFEKEGKERSMWEQWHIYFCYINKYYTLYSNLINQSRKNVYLSTNRMEDGLHFSGASVDNGRKLMSKWNDGFVKYPKFISRLNYSGQVL